uniref:Uncharacterized protein n=1 Tax=Acrobeloides nanus TaxID=290746 RepID=A0A914E3A3_9BILA
MFRGIHVWERDTRIQIWGRDTRIQVWDGGRRNTSKYDETLSFLYGLFLKAIDKDWWIHGVKAFGDREILETWYNLTKSNRNCIRNSLWAILKNKTEEKITSEVALHFTMSSCPNSSAEIQQLYNLCQEKSKNFVSKIDDTFKKLPVSIQEVIKKLETILKDNSIERNEEKVRAAFLPILKSLLEIPDEDLQKLADLYPDLAPIVIGDLKQPVRKIIQKLIEYCTTGNDKVFEEDEDFKQSMKKLNPYAKENFEKLLQAIENAPEQDLPEFVVKGIEEDVDEIMDSIFMPVYILLIVISIFILLCMLCCISICICVLCKVFKCRRSSDDQRSFDLEQTKFL